MNIESNASGPFALLLSLDRKFVSTTHNNIECFNANCDISYLGNKFTFDHYRDIVSRQIYSRYLVIVLDVRCTVVFFQLQLVPHREHSSYLTENTARTSQRTQPVPVVNILQGARSYVYVGLRVK
jgi:hypothetical protein